MERQIDEYKKAGYKVMLHHVDVPPKFAQERVAQRYVSQGRAVPPHTATDVGDKTRRTFDALRDKVDGWGAYSSHNIPGRKVRYAVLGLKNFKLGKDK
jgi:predicted ABC-type ATPase